jgi:hypothetical protein
LILFLEETTMKQVMDGGQALSIWERDDYTLTLARQMCGATTQELHLYGVRVTTAFHCHNVYVLADSATAATDQARCALKLSSYSLTAEQETAIVCIAERLPLIIRGWSGTEF